MRGACAAVLFSCVACGEVRLNEVMASNSSILADEDGDFSDIDFLRFVALADWRFFVPDAAGSAEFEGRLYSPCTVPLTLETDAFGDGRVLKVSRPARGYANWRATHFSLAEQCDPLVSDPLAKGADGVENLLRYALGLGRLVDVGSYLPQFRRHGTRSFSASGS